MKVQLRKLAHARSGDKGDTANVGLIALRDDFYPLLARNVTAARVKEHFKGVCKGEVERFELPNLGALNFLLHESLGGGGTLSLMTDAQGKTFSTALLRMEIEISDDEASGLELARSPDVRHTSVCRDLKEEVHYRDERQTEVCRTSRNQGQYALG